jgi:putative heme-binding domain-containing protein
MPIAGTAAFSSQISLIGAEDRNMRAVSVVLETLLVVAALAAGTALAEDPPPADDGVNPLERFAEPVTALPKARFEADRFVVRPGEVIVLTGSANAVFEQQQSRLETQLALSAAKQQPSVRHMSWDGDTVYEQARAENFGGWAEQFAAVGASTIIAWFGGLEALDDSRDDAAFAAAYGKLLDEFAKTTPRLVVISPAPIEKPLGRWVRDNTPRNVRLKKFTAIAQRLAKERGAIFVDIFTPLAARGAGAARLTDDGIHLTPDGQRIVADLIAQQLGVGTSLGEAQEPLRKEIVHKNRFWFDCWRTLNWNFPYSDRKWAMFSKPAGTRPPLAEELKQWKPFIKASDARVHALALGKTPPPLPVVNALPEEKRRPPDEELKAFTPRDGFEINLFASEADGLVKPILFTWDERGRLWAACAPSYPQLIPGTVANDYILICEDTDGDGRADKFTRFAEGLMMPTGLALGDGGVYVCHSKEIIHLRDTDGDDHADQRRVIFSGFGTGDAHQMINSLCWGPDGRLWFTEGLHIDSNVETPSGLIKNHQTAVWRMNPRTLELQPFLGNAAATENAWGMGFDDWGQAFYDSGSEPNAVYLDPALSPVPSRYLTKSQYWAIGTVATSKAKSMEIEFIGSRHLPDDLQGLMVKSLYVAGYVDLTQLTDDGTGFHSEQRGELVTSSSSIFRPLQVSVGPDSAIYICDWCNPIIGHYQASYRDPQRDHTHGRVWRMAYKDLPAAKAPALHKMSPPELIDQLASPERWVRQQAKEFLYRLPTEEVVAAADARLTTILAGKKSPGTTESGVKYAGAPADASAQEEHLLYELIGVFAGHEAVRPALIERMLKSPEPHCRAFGTHMIGLWADQLPAPLALLKRMVGDENPRVRMEAVVAASYVKSPSAVEVATLVLNQPRDPLLDYALTETVLTLKSQWFPAMEKGELAFDNQVDRVIFVLAADGSADVTQIVRRFSERPELTDDARAQLWAVLAKAGEPNDLRYALEHGARFPSVLDGLAVSALQRNKIPGGDLAEPLKPLLADKDESLRAAAISLAGAWHVKPLAAEIRRQISDGSAAIRVAAIGAIAQIEGRNALALLTPLVASDNPAQVRAAAMKAISSVDLSLAVQLAVEQIPAIANEGEMSDFLLPLVNRQGGANLLAEALEKVALQADQAKLAHRALSAVGHDESALIAVLNRALGVTAGTPEYSPELVERLAATVSQGDSERGRQVFLSKLANCIACHKVAGQGGDIGPDLSVLGSAVPAPQIIESILWPNRLVKEGFAATRVVTTEGQIFTGYKLKETADEVQLRDINTREVRRIPREDIEDTTDVGSVMPAGLTIGMTDAEFRDMIRYLAGLGRGGN